jgi:hypothetical protein
MTDLEQAERILRDVAKAATTVQEWWVVPVPIAKIKRPEFLSVLKRTRVKLRHSEWEDAREEARSLSQTGGIRAVTIVSVKTEHKINAMATFDNGTQTEGYQRKKSNGTLEKKR